MREGTGRSRYRYNPTTNVLRIVASAASCGSGAAPVSTFVGLSSTTSASAAQPGVYALSAVVTGGNSGLGFETSLQLAQAHAHSFILRAQALKLNLPSKMSEIWRRTGRVMSLFDVFAGFG